MLFKLTLQNDIESVRSEQASKQKQRVLMKIESNFLMLQASSYHHRQSFCAINSM